jgi:hypothetical protein
VGRGEVQAKKRLLYLDLSSIRWEREKPAPLGSSRKMRPRAVSAGERFAVSVG